MQTVVERLDAGGLVTRVSFDDGFERAVMQVQIDRNDRFGETTGWLRSRTGIDEFFLSQAAIRVLLWAAERSQTIRQMLADYHS